MSITSIRLQNYRSYDDNSFEFVPGVNIIVGPNAGGKTNLLEALYLSSVGSLMRSSKEFVIKNNKDWSRIDVLTKDDQQRVIKIKPQERPVFEVSGEVQKRLKQINILPTVLFEPNHLYQITTSPDMRRQLIDDILSKTDPEFASVKNSYLRILRQRNSLLKQDISLVRKQIFAWDVRLSEMAGVYVRKRLSLIGDINTNLSDVYSSIAGKNHKLDIRYESRVSTKNYSSNLLNLFQTKLKLDLMRGFTAYGPHRDDIVILLNDIDIRSVASRGETRSILLALKIKESMIIEDVFNKKPLLLLDDVFGELDGLRRKHLINFIANHQTFITTTDADIINHKLADDSFVLTIG